MNPRIPADYAEVGRWLYNFATSHGKRESPRIEAHLEMEDARHGRSYGLRLLLGALAFPPLGESPLELAYPDVADGRTRLAWCEELAARIRAAARELVSRAQRGRSHSA